LHELFTLFYIFTVFNLIIFLEEKQPAIKSTTPTSKPVDKPKATTKSKETKPTPVEAIVTNGTA